MTSPADLPDNIDVLKAIILASQAKMTEQDRVIERKEDRIFRLETLLVDFRRALYGATSEKGHLLPGSRLHANDERADQYHLALEDIETALSAMQASPAGSAWPLSMPRMKRLIHQRRRRKSHAWDAAFCQSTCHASKRLLHPKR